MKFSQDPISPVTVRKLVRGEIKVGEDYYRDNVVLRSDQVISGWQVPDVGNINAQHFAEHLSGETEIVLLGTGWDARVPNRELVFSMARRGIGFESMLTPAACRTFNILTGEGRNVVAFLIVR